MMSGPGQAPVAKYSVSHKNQESPTDLFYFLNKLKATKYSTVTLSRSVGTQLSFGHRIMNETVNIRLHTGKPITSWWIHRTPTSKASCSFITGTFKTSYYLDA